MDQQINSNFSNDKLNLETHDAFDLGAGISFH